MIVWVVGTGDQLVPGDQRLHGYDGDTGDRCLCRWRRQRIDGDTRKSYSTTGIAARGRIYVAA